jgi:hypothetical protein
MRPIPQPKHPLAVAVLAGVAAMYGYLASQDDRLSPTQVNIACAALKRQRPESAFRGDGVYGAGGLWRFHTPAYQGLLELTLVPTDYQDIRLPFRAMSGILSMLFLCGMYALLYSQCRSWSVSAFVAVLSSRIVATAGGGVWGIGSLESITPAGMVLSAAPLAVSAFLRYSRESDAASAGQWRLMLVFGVIGLMGNLHLVTATNLTLVLLLAYLAQRKFAPRALATAGLCAACALLGALPYLGYYTVLRGRLDQWHPWVAAESIAAAFRTGRLALLYPELLKELLDWRTLVGAVVLGVPAASVLIKLERFQASNRFLWGWMLAAAAAVAFGLHAVSQLSTVVMRSAPPVIDFVQASCLLLLPLYVLAAQEVTNLFRLGRDHRNLLRWGCAALTVLWMLPSDNLRVGRYWAAETAVASLPRPRQDEPSLWQYVSQMHVYVERHRERRDRDAELAAIARYARGRDNSIYLTDQGEFRMLAVRPIVAAPEDVRYYYYLCPSRLGEWMDRFSRQDRLLHPSVGAIDPSALVAFVDDLAAGPSVEKPPEEWYVILGAAEAPEPPGPLKPVQTGPWGKYWKLCRVR